MSKLDLTGRTFGRLSVVGPAPNHAGGRTQWLCRCSCGPGEPFAVRTAYLTCGDTASCGCLHRERAARLGRAKKLELAGRVFGRLTVRAESGRTAKGQALWLCDCSCGATTAQTSSRLLGGYTRSCGCLRDELMRARAAAVGSAKSVRVCRVCSKVYEAVGPQKDCSAECRREWHADDEARRRERDRAALEIIRIQRTIHASQGSGPGPAGPEVADDRGAEV